MQKKYDSLFETPFHLPGTGSRGESILSEPMRSPEEEYQCIRQKVQDSLGLQKDESDQEVQWRITQVLSEENKRHYMTAEKRAEYGKRLFDCLRGMDVLQPLLENDHITEIMVNGPDHIYIEEKGEVHRTSLRFESLQRLEDVIQQIVGQVNRHVNEAQPIVDARLSDGSRVNVILPPVAINGPILTIRKFRKKPISAEEMIEWKTMSRECADFIQKLVTEKYNIFICGGTGAGKTTLLNVISNYIPHHERIITIEDAAELRLSSLENVVTLEARPGGMDGKGKVTIRDLIKTSLRARPDRIVVGEVRGAEALDMLSAMNTGHEGSLSTGHANSCQDMISRIEVMALSASEGVPLEAIRAQIASAIDIYIYVSRMPDGSRKITQIMQTEGMKDNEIILEPLYLWKDGALRRTDRELYKRKEQSES